MFNTVSTATADLSTFHIDLCRLLIWADIQIFKLKNPISVKYENVFLFWIVAVLMLPLFFYL